MDLMEWQKAGAEKAQRFDTPFDDRHSILACTTSVQLMTMLSGLCIRQNALLSHCQTVLMVVQNGPYGGRDRID